MKSPFNMTPQQSDSFLPSDYISERNEARANLLTLTLFAIAMAGVVAAFFVTNGHWQSLRNRQEAINADYLAEGKKIDQLKTLESQRASNMEKAQITAALVEKLPRWAMLGEVTLRMPLAMRLDMLTLKSTRINPTPPPPPPGAKPAAPAAKSLVKNIADKGKDGKAAKDKPAERPKVEPPKFDYALTIEGTAPGNNDVADFLASLKRSPAFDKVEMTFIRDAKELGHEMRKFQITASLKDMVETRDLATSLQDLVGARATAMNLLKESVQTPAQTKKAPQPEQTTATADEGGHP